MQLPRPLWVGGSGLVRNQPFRWLLRCSLRCWCVQVLPCPGIVGRSSWESASGQVEPFLDRPTLATTTCWFPPGLLVCPGQLYCALLPSPSSEINKRFKSSRAWDVRSHRVHKQAPDHLSLPSIFFQLTFQANHLPFIGNTHPGFPNAKKEATEDPKQPERC